MCKAGMKSEDYWILTAEEEDFDHNIAQANAPLNDCW